MTGFPRLYAILDVEFTESRGLSPLDVLDAWLDAGVRFVQLRAKQLASGAFLDLAAEMARRAAASQAMFIVNDRADVARLAGAAGVHVGQDDLTPRDGRTIVGSAAIVGLSTHTAAQAAAAGQEPIDYLAIGPVFTTSTKDPGYSPVGLEMVRRVRAIARDVPVVAIGGITLERAPSVIEAGAASVAVISGLLPEAAARARQFIESLG